MGGKGEKLRMKSHTLPSSPVHSISSSSEFEFMISLSPIKSSANNLCHADELFYKGQLLPLHPSPRLSMVRALLLASPSASASDSRDSSASSNDSHSSFSSSAADLIIVPDCDSSRPSSAANDDDDDDDDDYKRFHRDSFPIPFQLQFQPPTATIKHKKNSLSKISSVFRKEPKPFRPDPSGSSPKLTRFAAKDVFLKYLRKVKPLYEKLSQKQHKRPIRIDNFYDKETRNSSASHWLSGNLRHPRRRRCASSCPSSIRSSPSHPGFITRGCGRGRPGDIAAGRNRAVVGSKIHGYADSSSMDALQSAIQGAIAHCKNSLI